MTKGEKVMWRGHQLEVLSVGETKCILTDGTSEWHIPISEVTKLTKN